MTYEMEVARLATSAAGVAFIYGWGSVIDEYLKKSKRFLPTFTKISIQKH